MYIGTDLIIVVFLQIQGSGVAFSAQLEPKEPKERAGTMQAVVVENLISKWNWVKLCQVFASGKGS